MRILTKNHQIFYFPLLPVLLPVSKIYLALRPNYEHKLVENSLTLIKTIQHAYTATLAASTLPEAAKAKIDKTISNIIYDMLKYTLDSLGRIFVRDAASDLLLDALSVAMYYTAINIIRVYEFSILDLLGVRFSASQVTVAPPHHCLTLPACDFYTKLPEKYQSPMVTVLESTVKNWRDAITYDSALQRSVLEDFADLYKQAYDKTWEASDFEGPTYPAASLNRRHYEFALASVRNRLFNCCNLGACSNYEKKKGEFAACQRCKWLRYCSQECYHAHWRTAHKLECAKPFTAADLEDYYAQPRIIIGSEADLPAPAANTSDSNSATTSTKQ